MVRHSEARRTRRVVLWLRARLFHAVQGVILDRSRHALATTLNIVETLKLARGAFRRNRGHVLAARELLDVWLAVPRAVPLAAVRPMDVEAVPTVLEDRRRPVPRVALVFARDPRVLLARLLRVEDLSRGERERGRFSDEEAAHVDSAQFGQRSVLEHEREVVARVRLSAVLLSFVTQRGQHGLLLVVEAGDLAVGRRQVRVVAVALRLELRDGDLELLDDRLVLLRVVLGARRVVQREELDDRGALLHLLLTRDHVEEAL